MPEEKQLQFRPNLNLVRATIDAIPAQIAILDRVGKIIWVNSAWQNATANFLVENANIDTNYLDACESVEGIYKDTAIAIATGIREAIADRGREFSLEYFSKQDRKPNWFVARAKQFQDSNSVGVIISYENITDYKQKEMALSSVVEGTGAVTGQEFFRSLVYHLANVLQIKHVFVTECLNELKPSTVRMIAFWCKNEYGENFEYSLADTPCEEVFGGKACYYSRNLQILFPKDRDLVLLEAESYIGVPMFDSFGKIVGHIVAIDSEPLKNPSFGISIIKLFAGRAAIELERQKMQEQLVDDALHDALTNLPNCNLFIDRLSVALKRFERHHEDRFAVLVLHLEGFELIQDRFGSRIGDGVIVAIGDRIQSCLRTSDTLARIKVDEFAILLEEIKSIEDAHHVADRIQRITESPFHLGRHEIQTSLSIGIFLSTTGIESPEAILESAKMTIYSSETLELEENDSPLESFSSLKN